MKAYYEYEDGTFWAIRTEGGDCFTAQGNKYEQFWPDSMLEAEKLSFESVEKAELKAAKMAAQKSASSLKQDAEFWRIAIEINALLLLFVPDEYKTPELCTLAVTRNRHALKYVPRQSRNVKLFEKAIYNASHALEYVDENKKTKELCLMAVSPPDDEDDLSHCFKIYIEDLHCALAYVPDALKTRELCLAALAMSTDSLEFVPAEFKTYEVCLEAVKYGGNLEHVPEEFKTYEMCVEALVNESATGSLLEYVPAKFKTRATSFWAVRKYSSNLKFVDVDKFSREEYTLICRMAFERI